MTSFSRIERFPPYVFNITGELKMAARRRGEDIIDMSMGNPDGPTPPHIVDKLVEAASAARHPRLFGIEGHTAIAPRNFHWYKRRYGVEIDPDTEAIVTIGSKEGLAHLMLATLDRGDTVLVPNPELSDSYLWRGHRRRQYPLGAHDAGRGFLRGNRQGRAGKHTQAQDDGAGFSQQPHRPVRRAFLLRAGHCPGQGT